MHIDLVCKLKSENISCKNVQVNVENNVNISKCPIADEQKNKIYRY